ncbi:MAG: hypothetical protein R2815_09330 [Flavobacteriales bacterium]
MVVFVTGAVPGDVVDVRVTEAAMPGDAHLRIVSPSPDRVGVLRALRLPHGGCKWQDLAYPKQLSTSSSRSSTTWSAWAD